MSREELRIKGIRLDPQLQARMGMCDQTVCEYAEAMAAGDLFPPLTVFHDGQDFWLADGWHRLEAYKRVGTEHVPCDVHAGGKRNAMLHAVKANQKHGLRRSNHDKKRSIRLLLSDPDWCRLSTKKLSKMAGVSQHLVSVVRGERPDEWDTDVRVDASGREFIVDRSNTGRKLSQPRLTVWRDESGTVIPEDRRQSHSNALWAERLLRAAVREGRKAVDALDDTAADHALPTAEIRQHLDAIQVLLPAGTSKATG